MNKNWISVHDHLPIDGSMVEVFRYIHGSKVRNPKHKGYGRNTWKEVTKFRGSYPFIDFHSDFFSGGVVVYWRYMRNKPSKYKYC